MKIIHVTDELTPSAGGLVSVPINLAAAQTALNHEVILLGRTGRKELLGSAETKKIPAFEKVKLDEAQQPGLLGKLFPTKAISFFKKYITEGSIVHLHGVWDPFLLLASKRAADAGASYIVTPHSMLHPWQMDHYVLPKKIVFSMGWRKMFDNASFIHTLTEAEAGFVKAFNFRSKTEIIPNGIYTESFTPIEPNPFVTHHPDLKKSPYILFLSRLSVQKGIAHLLDGFEKYAIQNPEIHLVLAGPDYGELEMIKNKLRNMKHANRVLLPGPIYGEEKLGALRGASCFALTSLNEGFSVALLEALACGLPVVISENCFFSEVEKHKAGIIAPLDATSISNAFETIFEDTNRMSIMGKRAKELVETNYTWPTIAKKMEEAYHNVIHR